MTREETTTKMKGIRAELEEDVKKYNELMLDGKASEALDMNTSMETKVNEYTALAKGLAFDACRDADDPMYEACKLLTFDTIRIKDENQEGVKYKVKAIDDTTKVIDLKKLQAYCGGSIGHDSKWIYALEKFNMLMTAQKCVDLGVDPKEVNDSYAMSNIAREYDLGKNPASKTNLLKTLTKIMQMMLGEEIKVGDEIKPVKAVSHDVNYLLSIYSKKGRKALTVSCANHNYMRQYVQEICHKVILGRGYAVDFKKEREK